MSAKLPFEERPYRKGVGIVLLNRDDLVFVGMRVDQTVAAWQLPQGGIDDGEDPRAAAIRELAEETGVERAEPIAESRGWLSYDLPPDLADKVWKGRYRGQAQKWYAMRFLGTEDDIRLDAHEQEFSAWKWAPMVALPDLIVPFKRPLYEQVVAEFRHLVAR
ncbi:MAG: RNA pyrophosphohydrolase [Alphaproteobacteria bacterium]